MPRFLPLLLIGALACSDFGTPFQPPAPPEYEGRYVTASGVVIDSLTGEVLRGVRVASGKQITFTDESGYWSLDVPLGDVIFSSSPTGYERASVRLDVKGPLYLAILVRRNAPIVRECFRDGDRILATLTDLQGRKSIERWSRSNATFATATGPVQRMAITWDYLDPPDYYDWPIALAPIPPNATALRWDVYDSEGNRYLGTCDISATRDE